MTNGECVNRDELMRVHTRLDSIERDLRELLKLQTEMYAGCMPCKEMLKAHEVILHGVPGNGSRPGLVGLVGRHCELLERHEERHDQSDAMQIKQRDRNEAMWSKRQMILLGGGVSLLVSVTSGVAVGLILLLFGP